VPDGIIYNDPSNINFEYQWTIELYVADVDVSSEMDPILVYSLHVSFSHLLKTRTNKTMEQIGWFSIYTGVNALYLFSI
jgi:hypothetical protein